MRMPWARPLTVAALLAISVITLAACGGTPTPTPTPVPPTATPVPPTATPVPPTPTPAPAIATFTPVGSAATTAATPGAATPPAATPAAGVAATAAERDMVAAAFANLAKATSFGMTVTVQGPSVAMMGSGDILMEIVQSPTRSVHMKIGDQLEMIVIGEDAYMKAGSTTWQKSAMPADQLQQLQDSLDFASTLSPDQLAAVKINKLGSERIGSVDTDVFSIMVTDPQPQTTTMWISRADKTVVQQAVEEGGNSVLVSFYGWNKVKIQAPAM